MKVGRQVATIQSHRLVTDSPSGKWYVLINFSLDETGESASVRLYLTSGAAVYTKKGLLTCGFDIQKTNLEDLSDYPTLLAGNKVELDMQEEEYRGEISIKVKWINPIPKPGELNKEKERLKSVNMMLRAAGEKEDNDYERAEKQTKAATKPKKPTPPPEDEPEADAEEVPPSESDEGVPF